MTAQEFYERLRRDGVLVPEAAPKYGEKLSTYITNGVDHVVSPDTGTVWLHKPLLDLFDAARAALGAPLLVNAGSRTPAHEAVLAGAGYHTAGDFSPHTLSALDVARRGVVTNSDLLAALRKAAGDLGFPLPRLGHKIYNETLVHVDLVFFFFTPYAAHPHPADWPELEAALRAKLDASWRPGVEW